MKAKITQSGVYLRVNGKLQECKKDQIVEVPKLGRFMEEVKDENPKPKPSKSGKAE